jgi:hypothetical protein
MEASWTLKPSRWDDKSGRSTAILPAFDQSLQEYRRHQINLGHYVPASLQNAINPYPPGPARRGRSIMDRVPIHRLERRHA